MVYSAHCKYIKQYTYIIYKIQILKKIHFMFIASLKKKIYKPHVVFIIIDYFYHIVCTTTLGIYIYTYQHNDLKVSFYIKNLTIYLDFRNSN